MNINLEKVSSQKHHQLKVATDGRHQNNASIHLCHLALQEISAAAAYYPIFLLKDSDTGQFQPVALFGLDIDENIYQQANLWNKCYQPLKLTTQPFFLVNNEAAPELAINVSDPRVQNDVGEPLFEASNATVYLKQQAASLSDLTQGFVLNNVFINELSKYDLIEPVELDIAFADGQQRQLDGLYTVNREMLEHVDALTQQQFEKSGYVKIIADMLGSANHVKVLIDLKNQLNKN